MGNLKQHDTRPTQNGDYLNESILNNNGRSFIQVDRMGILQEVEVGPISIQKDADKMAVEHERNNAQEIWTGQWRTTVPDRLTIVQGIKKSAIVRGVQGAKGKSFTKLPPVKQRTQLANLSELKVADHVVLTHGVEENHGIVLNKQDDTFTLMEFTKGVRNYGGGTFYQNLTIQETKHVFGNNSKVFVVFYDKGEALSDALVLSNVRGIIARANYDDLSHTCESLARRCKTGQLELESIDTLFKAFLRYSFWPFVSFLIIVDPIYAVAFTILAFLLGLSHEVVKRLQDIYLC